MGSSRSKRKADDHPLPSSVQPRNKKQELDDCSSSQKSQLDPLLYNALSITLQQQTVLHWRDAMALGGACKETYKMWKDQHEEAYMSPLLKLLESMLGTQEDGEDDDYDYDSLRTDLHKDYESFSTANKCKEMVLLLQRYVRNMHKYCLVDLSNPTAKNSKCDPTEWSMGFRFEMETIFLHEHPRRSTLALQIAIFGYALSALEEGGHYYFNDVFRGVAHSFLGGGTGYDCTICHSLSLMFPFRDEDLVTFLRKLYPSANELGLLGPLVNKVVLAAPFFKWVPPCDGDNDGAWFDLPLETMNEAIIHEYGMQQYLAPHCGIDY